MARVIGAINMSLDGFCDHDKMSADDEVHEHYSEVLRGADVAMWGRVTFRLMEYWRSVAANPTGNRATDDFAATIDGMNKVVYSRTLDGVDWRNTELKREIDVHEIEALKQQDGHNILVGSPSLIVQFANLGLIDEFQIVIHPTVIGKGMTLFNGISERIDLELSNTKTFGGGAVLHSYKVKKNAQ
jgi:dihydrofolate reductase